jgi:signal transduction histidine kinase
MLRAHIVITGAFLVLTTLFCSGQTPPDWRTFRRAEGLAEDQVAAISVSAQGQTTAFHSSGRLSRYDGSTVTTLEGPPLPHGKVLESPSGQLWSVTTNGLYEYRDDQWLLHDLSELRIKPSQLFSLDTPVLPIRQGLVLVLLPHKLLLFICGPAERPHVEPLLDSARANVGPFTGQLESRETGLWVLGERGLMNFSGPLGTLKRNASWREYVATNLSTLGSFRKPHLLSSSSITLTATSADDKTAVVRFDGQKWAALRVTDEPLTDSWEDDAGALWAVARHRLLRWDAANSRFAVCDYSPAQQSVDIATEPGGVFWVATPMGLHRHATPLWSHSSFVQTESPIQSMVTDDAGKVWFTDGRSLHLLTENSEEVIRLPSPAGRENPATRIFSLRTNTFVVAAGQDLFTFDASTRTLSEPAKVETPSALLGLVDGKLLFRKNSTNESTTAADYALYDGHKYSPFQPSLPNQELGSLAGCSLTARNGDLWLGAQRGTILVRQEKAKAFPSEEKSAPAQPVAFAELTDETIWAATSERVWRFDGEHWLEARRGFDGITALHGAKDGSLWVGTRAGLFRYIHGAWLQNGVRDGLPSEAVTCLCEDASDRLWAGTAAGLAQFHPAADLDAPQSFIRPEFAESTLREGSLARFGITGVDQWNMTASSQLLFSCRLDSSEWSPYQSLSDRTFPSLPPGKHVLQVRSIDRNGNVGASPATFEFSVVIPWYREPRVLAVVAPASAIVLFFAWLALNRHVQLRRSYAEIEMRIAERTLELERANRELLHSQKMTALGTLAAGIAHDFNNILSIIEGSTQLIEENLHDARKVHTRLSRIKAVVAQGSGIVKAMLGFSRESSPSAPADINSIVEDTLKLLGDRFLREVRITFTPAEHVPLVAGSRDFIQQILLNLIFNAAEAKSSDKAIMLTTFECPAAPLSPFIAPKVADGYVCVSVQDFGSGIAPEVLPRIFEPFFTTKALSTRRGTGLGLSMVYELAKKLGAGISVETAIGKGTTFSLLLPIHPAPPNDSKPMQPILETTAQI